MPISIRQHLSSRVPFDLCLLSSIKKEALLIGPFDFLILSTIYDMVLITHEPHQQIHPHFQAVHQDEYHDLD